MKIRLCCHGSHLRWNVRIRGRLAGVASFAVAIQLLAAPQLLAQGPGRPPDIDALMETLTERLELSDEQVTQVRPIFEDQFRRMREAFSQAQGDRPSMRSAMMEIRDQTDDRLAEVLTDAQMKEYRKYREEQRQQRGGPPGSLPD